VEELLASTTSRELAEWMAYEQLEPFPDQKMDARVALLCQAVIAAAGGKSSMANFLIHWDKPWIEEVRKIDAEEEKIKISSSLPRQKKDGLIVMYDGDGPPIKRIGKRGKPTPSKKRLQEILRGKSR
jgi:hypothetical protein